MNVKRLLGTALVFTLVAVPGFAAKSGSVTVPEDVIVGSTQIAAGHYKVVYDGAGSPVKVTLSKPGIQPITLDANVSEVR